MIYHELKKATENGKPLDFGKPNAIEVCRKKENNSLPWEGKPIWMDLTMHRDRKSEIIGFEPIPSMPGHFKLVPRTQHVPTEEEPKDWFKMFDEKQNGGELQIRYLDKNIRMSSKKLNRTYYYYVNELGCAGPFEDC